MLVVAASRVRTEEKALLAALDRRRVPYRHLDTRRFWCAVGDAPGFGAVLNREIAHTRSLYLARVLEAAGVRVVNRAEVVEVCGDKLLTSLALHRRGVPTPPTALALTPGAALPALEHLGWPAVVKPLAGSWGRLAARVRDREESQVVLEHREALPSPQQHIVYLQAFVDGGGRDIRVLLTGDEVVGAAYRNSAEWRTNGARAATFHAFAPDGHIEKLALAAAQAVGGGVLAVDVIESRDGEAHVLEVNHTPEFRGLQAALADRTDVAEEIIGYVLREVGS